MSKCLLIVDVQAGFINEYTAHIPKLVEKLQHKYKHVYAVRFYNKKDSLYRKLIKWDRFDIDSADFQLAFSPAEHVKIIDKDVYSCITDEFIQSLKQKNINEVDICGVDTDICVTKCAVDLFENDIIPFVLANYCGSYAGVDAHTTALKTLERFIGSDQIIL